MMLKVALTLLLLGACLAVQELGQNEGVVECILKKVPSIIDPSKFCGGSLSENAECHFAHAALKLCLINNNCQYDQEDQEVSVQCWNCWHDMPTDSQHLEDFQQKVKDCSQPYTAVLLGLLVLLSALLL